MTWYKVPLSQIQRELMIPLIRHIFGAVTASAALLFFAISAFAIDFDSTFGIGGKFMTSFSDSGQPSTAGARIVIQPSGRIVVVGQHQQQGTSGRTSGIALAGLTSAGVLDAAFGTGGKTLFWDAGFHRFFTDSQMLPDGSVVVLYQMWQSATMNRPELAKFGSNGQLDPTFLPDLNIVPNQTNPVRIAIGSGGKIYVLVRNSYQFSLIRLNADGSRDLTFGPDGLRNLNLNRIYQPTVTSLIETEGGKLLVSGTYYSQFEGYSFLVRFDNDTNIDRSFGVQGVARLSLYGGSVGIEATRIQADGKILVGGYWTFLGSNTYLARLTARGRLDYSFGTRGVTMNAYNDINGIRGMAIAPDGKIHVAGSTGEKALPSNQRLFVTRYSSAGVRESFLVTNFIGTREAAALDIVLQPDGKALIAGFTQNPADTFLQLSSARFNP